MCILMKKGNISLLIRISSINELFSTSVLLKTLKGC